MTKVLIITYYWPPAGGPGVQRWLKFSKYLLQFNIEPVILTVKPEDATYPILDESLAQEIPPEIKVYRTTTNELFGTYKKATNREQVPYSGFASEKSSPGFKEKVARFIRGNFFFPDPRRPWRKHARKMGERLIDDHKIDLIITTGPPQSTHLIGLDLKKKLGVKWVADFRDPWTDIYYYKDFYPTPIARNLDERLEISVLKACDLITTASPGFGEIFNSKINLPQKIKVFTNGYDEDDFNAVEVKPSNKIEITYTGTLTKLYPLDTLITALAGLTPELQERIQLNIVGKIDEASTQLLKSSGLKVELNFPGYVDHSAVLDYLNRSSFLLLIIPEFDGNRGVIPAKLFEYIGSGRRILGIGPEQSDAAVIVNTNYFGRFFKPGDSQLLQQWLKDEMATDLTEQQESPNRPNFSRKFITEKMAETMEYLLRHH